MTITLDDIERQSSVLRKLRLKYNDDLHEREIKVYEELAESIFEMRVGKYIESGKDGGSLDSFLFDFLKKIKEFYISMMTGNLILKGHFVLCEIKKPFTLGSRIMHPGDIVMLDLRNVSALLIAEYIIPYKIS
ncbi:MULTISPECIES: hypothetical protein [Acidianus]|uniref:Uncharacterized protein n=1 Tax=Candidatus Acidianus copahuensis TaxID=1160895 RepID=A0A031LRB5_9CREN|nr:MULTISPECIES: hypothetical protein [Acidianus]EZQ06939.1 hypothetical protein CM19_06125 [Candidatus Acidianus copahuensis]NON61736.1 hypothetical protein [Acidianus sp. RZ1]